MQRSLADRSTIWYFIRFWTTELKNWLIWMTNVLNFCECIIFAMIRLKIIKNTAWLSYILTSCERFSIEKTMRNWIIFLSISTRLFSFQNSRRQRWLKKHNFRWSLQFVNIRTNIAIHCMHSRMIKNRTLRDIVMFETKKKKKKKKIKYKKMISKRTLMKFDFDFDFINNNNNNTLLNFDFLTIWNFKENHFELHACTLHVQYNKVFRWCYFSFTRTS